MVICSRCQQPVDETVRKTCPLCFTPVAGVPSAQSQEPSPLGAPLQGYAPGQPLTGGSPQVDNPMPMPGMAPNPYPSANPVPPGAPMPPPTARPGTRVSLTGEVIDSSMPGQGTSSPSYVGGAPGGRQSAPGTARPTNISRPEVQPQTKSGGGAGIVALLAILVLAAAGVGGWWFITNRTNPKDQAKLILTASLKQDTNTLYPLIKMNEEDAKKYPDAQTLKKEIDGQIQKARATPIVGSMVDALLKSAKENVGTIVVGEPVFDGGKATVSGSYKINIPGVGDQTQQVNMKMVNDMGVWKLDATEGVVNTNQSMFTGSGGAFGR